MDIYIIVGIAILGAAPVKFSTTYGTKILAVEDGV
jgi:hypothetical protein